MNFKTIAAASVIAFLPMTSFAAVDVAVTSNDGIQADAATLVGTSPTIDGVVDTLFPGAVNALTWNMTVVGSPNPANTGGVVDFDFSLSQKADITVMSTQLPPGNLKDLAVELLLDGNSLGVSTYGPAGFGEIFATIMTSADAGTLTVRSYWDSVAGPFSKTDVDFIVLAENFGGNAIPLPASALLLVGALGGLGLLARRRA